MGKQRIAGAILGALVYLAAPATAPAAATAVQVPLVDQNGRTFTLASLDGTPTIVTFVAAHCTDACPLVNAQFARAAQILRERNVRARLLTITLDPEHDSQRDMARIARTFSADRSQWIVAGGSSRNVHEVMNAFGVVAVRGKDGYADEHTTYVYLLDRHGRLRKTVLASTDLSDQIVTEVAAAWHELSA
jgi:protein SCO1/2